MSITCGEILQLLEKVAPAAQAADWDNVGLQLGVPSRAVETIVLALDPRPETVRFAVENGADLLIAHHPLLFKPLKRIDSTRSPGREATLLLEKGTALYVGHTNVDCSPTLSMNATIGRKLPLRDFGPLASPVRDPGLKLVTFVPRDSIDAVRESLAAAGAGEIGEYTGCSFNLSGTGTFCGSAESSPTLGERGRLERVDEIRLEMVCPRNRLDPILTALWDSHPYEEVAYDLYTLSGYKSDSHFLWFGEAEGDLTLAEFAAAVKRDLGEGVAPVKFAGDPGSRVRRVAWCSGGGKSLIPQAAACGADVYLTGDTGHHDALDALALGMSLVDLDHYYSERFFIDNLRAYLYQELGEERVDILSDPNGRVYHAAPSEDAL